MLFWLNLQHDHSSPEWTVEYKFKQSSTSLKRQFTQTCMNVFVLNTKEDILKNVGNRAVFLVPQNSLITNFLQNIYLRTTFAFLGELSLSDEFLCCIPHLQVTLVKIVNINASVRK